jgi:hypothetical protein
MKYSECLINVLFNLNRKDLLLDLNRNLITDKLQAQIIRGALEIAGSGRDLTHENFLNWEHRETNSQNLVNYFNSIVKTPVLPPPDIHRQIRIEHDYARIGDFIKNTQDKNSTYEIRVENVINLYKSIIHNTELKKIHSAKGMLISFLDSLEKKEEDEYLKRSVKIDNENIRSLMFSDYIFPRPHTILGLPGRYKTSIAINILDFLLFHQKKGLYFSLEDSRHVMLKKWLSVSIGQSKNDFIQNKVTYESIKHLRSVSNEFLFIVDNSCTVDDIVTLVDSQMAKSPIDFIMVDYVQLVSSGGEKGKSKREVIGDFMEAIKDMCSKYLISAFITSQAPKQDNEFKVLGLGDEKESGAISELTRWAASTNFESNSHALIWNLYKGETLGKCRLYPEPRTGLIQKVERMTFDEKT